MITKNSEFFHEISGLILFCLNQQDSRQRAGRNLGRLKRLKTFPGF